MTDVVTRDAGTVTRDATAAERNRRMRARRRLGLEEFGGALCETSI